MMNKTSVIVSQEKRLINLLGFLSGLFLFALSAVFYLWYREKQICTEALQAAEQSADGGDETVAETDITIQSVLQVWKDSYFTPVEVDYSGYPDFLRGAWAPRMDVARVYLTRTYDLKEAGIDTIMLGIDVVMDPETGEAKTLGDDAFKFYIQSFQKEGFRVIIIPNPGHPNFDMGEGFDWGEGDSSDNKYKAGKELIDKMMPIVVKWAEITEEFNCYGFIPILEPHAFAGDNDTASVWLQEILPQIKTEFSGKVGATDIMYNYTGYDFILGCPPAGRKPGALDEWVEDVDGYIGKGLEYVDTYGLDGFALYEWGPYMGGVWYEDTQMCTIDQCLNDSEAKLVVEAGIELQEDRDGLIGSFPLIGTGWIDWGTSGFPEVAHWYGRVGRDSGFEFELLEGAEWDYEQLIWYESVLAGEEWQDICTLDSWSICAE